jgi:hypothetical protein
MMEEQEKMAEAATKNTDLALEIHYKELVRLADNIDLLTRSAFDDIKLLAGIGVLISWKPFLSALTKNNIGENVALLFLGFIVIALALGIIGFAALMKQSVALFYLKEIQHYEREIRGRLSGEESRTFRVAGAWADWSNATQRRLGKRFYAFFYIIICLFPACVLWMSTTATWRSFNSGWILAFLYFLIAVTLCWTHYKATTKIVYTKENLG